MYQGPLTMAVQQETISHSLPWECWESIGDWGSERTCSDYTDVHTILSGLIGSR